MRNAPVLYVACCTALMLYVACREASPFWSPGLVAVAILLATPRRAFSKLWKHLRDRPNA